MRTHYDINLHLLYVTATLVVRRPTSCRRFVIGRDPILFKTSTLTQIDMSKARGNHLGTVSFCLASLKRKVIRCFYCPAFSNMLHGATHVRGASFQDTEHSEAKSSNPSTVSFPCQRGTHIALFASEGKQLSHAPSTYLFSGLAP